MLTRLSCRIALSILILLLSGRSFTQGRFSDVGKRVSRAVVKLESFDADKKPLAEGTGFIVSSKGLIVTNYHVIRGAYFVVAICSDKEMYQVEGIVEIDAVKDFAVLKVTAFGLPTVELGNSNDIQVGEEVIAIGHPLGLDFTVSNGVISQRREKQGFSMLQTTAPVSPGNSGGPLVNLKGQVIGVVTEQKAEGQNLNFALPINYVRAVLESATKVQFRLSDIAKAQATHDEKEATELIAKLFTLYEDKYKTYSAVVPKSWKLSESEAWAQDKQTYFIIAMVAPESAARAEVNGYLSAGIRIEIRMPPQGKIWKLSTTADYAPAFAKQILQANQGFVQTSSGDASLGTEQGKVLEFIGENRNISEPEKLRYYVLAKQKCVLTIECVSPASEFKDYEMLFRLFIKSFKFTNCPAWKDGS